MDAGPCADCLEPKGQEAMALKRCRKCMDAMNEHRRGKYLKK